MVCELTGAKCHYPRQNPGGFSQPKAFKGELDLNVLLKDTYKHVVGDTIREQIVNGINYIIKVAICSLFRVVMLIMQCLTGAYEREKEEASDDPRLQTIWGGW